MKVLLTSVATFTGTGPAGKPVPKLNSLPIINEPPTSLCYRAIASRGKSTQQLHRLTTLFLQHNQ